MTGVYKFTIASDDNSDMYIGLDPNGDPFNMTKILEFGRWVGPWIWTKYSEQTSSEVTLTAGQKYLYQCYHKEVTAPVVRVRALKSASRCGSRANLFFLFPPTHGGMSRRIDLRGENRLEGSCWR